MILALILLLALPVQAQMISSDTSVSILDDVKLSNLGKDVRAIVSGRAVITGLPSFRNGYCFGDGSCQTTAYSASGATIAVSAAFIGNGSTAGTLGINSSSVPVFQSGKYPPNDGSLITNIAITESQVSNLTSDLAGKVSKTGDLMTGSLTIVPSTGTGLNVNDQALWVDENSVQIGTTSIGGWTGITRLTVTNAKGSGGELMLQNNDFQGSIGSGMYFSQGAATGNTYSAINAWTGGFSSAGSLVLNNIFGGNVGIGVTTPRSKLDVSGSASFGSGATKSTFTATGELLSGTSVYAGSFWGDGTHLSGVTSVLVGVATMSVNSVHDDFTSLVTGSQNVFTLSQGVSSGTAVSVYRDGNHMNYGVDYTFANNQITFVTAPASNTSALTADYYVNTSTQPGAIVSGTTAGGDLTGTYPNPQVIRASTTGNGYVFSIYNGNSAGGTANLELRNDSVSSGRTWGFSTNYDASGGLSIRQSASATGSAYSAGTSRMVFDASGNVGIGTASPDAPLTVIGNSSLGTLKAAGTQLYYCNGGASIGILCRGNGCTCVGGTETGLGVYVP